MFTKLLLIGAATAALGAIALPAKATTINLDLSGLPTGPITSFTQGGYTITPLPGDPGDQVTVQNVGGTNVLVDGQPNDVFGSEMLITRTAGGTFNLVSFDLANLDNPGGGVVSVGSGSGFRVELDGGAAADAYSSGSSTFTTVAPGNLTGITGLFVNFVSFSPEALTFAADNIVLSSSSVPEPFSLALLGIGVVGLGLVRRRKR
jgi:hypothetical protein